MKHIFALLLIAVLCTQIFAGAKVTKFSLYSDRRGKRVGDVITVLITESSKASNEAGTQTAKEHGVSASGDKGSGLLRMLPSFGFGAGTNANYKGKGETNRQGSLQAKLTARITEVLDNGNLLIKGSKIGRC